ncbi:hypothetical protein BJ165DRAFT_269768 [Panaeolus papilionaceus]|nr:hypothetical protein BJ165DRAFT_269768 [Panaeolus papilionaceus]
MRTVGFTVTITTALLVTTRIPNIHEPTVHLVHVIHTFLSLTHTPTLAALKRSPRNAVVGTRKGIFVEVLPLIALALPQGPPAARPRNLMNSAPTLVHDTIALRHPRGQDPQIVDLGMKRRRNASTEIALIPESETGKSGSVKKRRESIRRKRTTKSEEVH